MTIASSTLPKPDLTAAMDRLRAIFTPPKKADEAEYEPLTDDNDTGTLEGSTYTVSDGEVEQVPFSWLEYSIFVLLGVAMLWSWNMFLAAAPYFQKRFASDPWVLENFQSAITSTFTFTSLAAMVLLTNIQSTASYPFRISTGLLTNTFVFATMALTTKYFLSISAGVYLGVMLVLVCLSAWSTGLIQNGALAYAGSFGRPEYTQAIMAGQGVAGVLPAIAQMSSVLFVSAPKPSSSGPDEPVPISNAAGIYFLTAVLVSLLALASFFPLVRRHNTLIERRMAAQLAESITSVEEAERAARRYVSIPRLFRKLPFVSGAVFMCMLVAMFFPVFTSKILSVHQGEDPDKRLFTPGVFIPLGFFFWNLGDLLGRMAAVLPLWGLRDRPALLFAFGVARTLFLPLYLLCNIRGRGAVVDSDLFYLLVVQFPFGLTNGWLCSAAMMTAGDWVDDSEKEAAGGFMGLSLVTGLTAGSLLSFTAAGI